MPSRPTVVVLFVLASAAFCQSGCQFQTSRGPLGLADRGLSWLRHSAQPVDEQGQQFTSGDRQIQLTGHTKLTPEHKVETTPSAPAQNELEIESSQLPAQDQDPAQNIAVLSGTDAQPVLTSGDAQQLAEGGPNIHLHRLDVDGEELPFLKPQPITNAIPSGIESSEVESDFADDAPSPSDADLAVEADADEPSRYPIDLPTVLRLAGADNWGVQLAEERIREARASLDAAKVLWLPSLNAGLGYTKHDGQIQATEGEVIDVSRNALFVGGGAGIGRSPLTGGGGGPARLFVDLSLTDAIFQPLAARQLVSAAEASHVTTFNNTLLEATLAYYNLVAAQGRLANARLNLANAEEVLRLTEAFVDAGKGSRADISRARVEASNRQQELVRADLSVHIASAELARILQLDPEKLGAETLLVVLEDKPVPVELVSESCSLPELIAQGLFTRPEMTETQALLEASRQLARAERWRPFIPNIYAGASSGGFGGGVNDTLTQLDGRSDFDILAVWQLRNLGIGQEAARREQSSRFRQALLQNFRIRDEIATEVTVAWHQVLAERKRLELAEANVQQAFEAYDRSITRIKGLFGLPLEVLQTVRDMAATREAYLAALIGYNQAQAALLRAIGQPIGVDERLTPN